MAAESVRVFVPVVFDRSIGSVAINEPPGGGQSRLVEPQTVFGDVPFTSHALVLRGPEEHVPPRAPSLVLPSPTQRGHGSASVGPL